MKGTVHSHGSSAFVHEGRIREGAANVDSQPVGQYAQALFLTRPPRFVVSVELGPAPSQPPRAAGL